ncbi:MAG: hypothetical protein JXA82_14280 [Sedimentisphaerales bacterium]|nr:hypothetical protein [Sedimentisphaerales bacterium]
MMTEISNHPDDCLKKSVFSKGLALLIGVVGIFAVFSVWVPIITKHRFENFSDVVFLFIFPIPCTLVGLYFLHTAGRLWPGISSNGIHKLSVCLSFIFAIMALNLFSILKESTHVEDDIVWGLLQNFPLIILGGLFYLSVKRCLLKWFSVSEVIDYNAHRKATKLYFFFLALSFWNAISSVTQLLPKNPDYEHVPANQWLEALIIFGSIPPAFWCYRFGLKFFLKEPPDENGHNRSTLECLDAGSSPA